MIASSVKIKNHPCFRDHWSGLDQMKPISLIIGKNNTGKSHLLQLVRALCDSNPLASIKWSVKAKVHLDEESLKLIFRPGTSGGELAGGHWRDHGVYLANKDITWTKDVGEPKILWPEEFDPECGPYGRGKQDVRSKYISEKLHSLCQHPMRGKGFRELYADRDIRAEKTSNIMELGADGSGATNIIRRFLNSENPNFPRNLIRVEMLDALNQIFGEDGHFREITVQHKDGDDPAHAEDMWEIYLEQEHKGLIALSSSGSSLKTVFLVLLNLLAIPKIDDSKQPNQYVFAFEELENNLHPSLLRRLLAYIEEMISRDSTTPISDQPTFFLTTHSNVALDYFAGKDHAQIIHVTHDGKSGKTQTISQSANQLSVIRDLGSKPSDLLQANGVIWVEGPSDRIYLNKWIEIYGDGELEEGRHYQCMFYGGGLLANLQVASDEEATSELINLMKINPNTIVVSDSDRKKAGAHLKSRVLRIRDELSKLDRSYSFHWILEAREIENYLTGDLVNKALVTPIANLASPTQYESFFPKKSETTKSYLEITAKLKNYDKTELAMKTVQHMTKKKIKDRFDLDNSINRIVQIIRNWN